MAIQQLHHVIYGFEKRERREPQGLDGQLMAVMHVGDRAVVVAYTSNALERSIAGCHLRADQAPDTVCNVQAVCRTVGTQPWRLLGYTHPIVDNKLLLTRPVWRTVEGREGIRRKNRWR